MSTNNLSNWIVILLCVGPVVIGDLLSWLIAPQLPLRGTDENFTLWAHLAADIRSALSGLIAIGLSVFLFFGLHRRLGRNQKYALLFPVLVIRLDDLLQGMYVWGQTKNLFQPTLSTAPWPDLEAYQNDIITRYGSWIVMALVLLAGIIIWRSRTPQTKVAAEP